MNKNTNRIKVDREKLKNIIKNNNMTNNEFSRSLGRDSSFIGKIFKDENYLMSATDYLLIKSMYGVDIEYKEEIKIENNVIKTVKDLTPDELSKLIYKAVFGAVKHAWEDDKEE